MPTIEVSARDLCRLASTTPSRLEDDVLYAKGELESSEGGVLRIDIKDTNRPDLWSTEGVAREIKGRRSSPGMPTYAARPSGIRVKVEPGVLKIRPRAVAAVVRDLKLTPEALAQLIQLQEKVSLSFGRNRKEVAMGVYDLSRVSPPITYRTVKPGEIRFVSLGMDRPLTPKQIIELHPKGKEFGHLLEGRSEYPVFMDSRGEVLSMPPIINSARSGRVTTSTRNLFIECTGFDMRFLMPALNSVVAALADRGGSIGSVEVFHPGGRLVTPDLTPGKSRVSIDYVNRISGLGLNAREIVSLLKKARYDAAARKGFVEVRYPAYRQDIMHPRDIVEDVLISRGYNTIAPERPRIPTIGEASRLEYLAQKVAEVMVGLGLQEIMSHILTSNESLFDRMLLPRSGVCDIKNPVSANWSVMRNSVLPSLIEFLSKNKHVDYPQRVFELGDCVLPDNKRETRSRDERRLAVALTYTSAGYEDASSVLDALARAFGTGLSLKPTDSPSFMQGRAASILLDKKPAGIVGEVHPQVLNNWNLEKPVAAFELSLEPLKGSTLKENNFL